MALTQTDSTKKLAALHQRIGAACSDDGGGQQTLRSPTTNVGRRKLGQTTVRNDG